MSKKNSTSKQKPHTCDAYEPSKEEIKQNSSYTDGNKCKPDNNIFWEDGSNPLSSKGN